MAVTYMDYKAKGGFWGFKVHLHLPAPNKPIQEYHNVFALVKAGKPVEEAIQEMEALAYAREEALRKEHGLSSPYEQALTPFRSKLYRKRRNDLFEAIGMTLFLAARSRIAKQPQWYREEDEFYFETFPPVIYVRRAKIGEKTKNLFYPIESSLVYPQVYKEAVDGLIELWPEFEPFKDKILSKIPTRKKFMIHLSHKYRQNYGDEWLNMLKIREHGNGF